MFTIMEQTEQVWSKLKQENCNVKLDAMPTIMKV